MRRFLKIDKLSTAMGTDDNKPHPYRFGYGVLDLQNARAIFESHLQSVFKQRGEVGR